jgi:plasmid stabilization system protein ParE
MKLRFTPRAIDNITEAADYLRARNPVAAERVRASIYESLPYLVYYMVDEAADELVILGVQHPAREREHDDA